MEIKSGRLILSGMKTGYKVQPKGVGKAPEISGRSIELI
ncbi:hypothetical protein NT6N_16530 [Oceaniferula spumae]|uniref:Uncharacterized protein n=1 Tax=Oceaniferula spumae TaxID=2979115 RepID=A0AAT9FKZ1_9BACT